MHLAAVDDRARLSEAEIEARLRPSARWEEFPHSILSHHGGACCEVARQWVLAMDFAQLNGADISAGPRWLRERYKWGPTQWPAHWCDVVERKEIDCGAHAALAQEVFAARGLTAFPAQLVQQYGDEAADQWRLKWAAGEAPDHWIGDGFIYHEGAALLVGEDEVKLWDASAGWWINHRSNQGYGALLAVRICTSGHYGGGDGLRWGEHRIKPGAWHNLKG